METSEQIKDLGLGYLVWWGLREVDIPRAELRQVFTDLGLARAVPRDPRPSAMLARACREALVGKGSEWAFDRVRDDADATTAALSCRTVDAGAEQVGYVQLASLRIEKATGAVTRPMLDPAAAAILDAAEERFTHLRDHATTTDLGAALTHSMRGRRREPLLGAVEVNGVFFVRREKAETVHALRAWVTSRGFGEVSVLAIDDEPASRTQVAVGTKRTIESRVAEVLAEARDLRDRIQNAEEDEEVDRILGPCLDRFALAENAADLYADVLGAMASDLRASIAEARAEFARRLL